MASFITAGNATNGLQVSSDNTGILELKTGTGSGTTAVTFSTGQRATFPSTIAVGNTTPATTGAGITFPAAQSASSDANTLDDYEEGTISSSSLGLAYATPGTSSFSYSNRRGTYTKIGNVVYFTIDIRLSAFTKGTASGSLFVTGLPFAQRDTGGFDSARCTIQLYDWAYTTSPIIAAVLNNSTSLAIERMVSNAVTTTIDDPKASSIIWITGFYLV